MNEADSNLFRQIHRRLNDHQSWAHAYGNDRNLLAGALVTDLMLAVEGEDVVFLTAAADRETGSAKVAIITRRALVLGDVEPDSDGHPTVEVTVEPLSRISALKPHGRQNSMVRPEWRVDWPDQVTMTLILDDGRSVVLPYEHVSDDTGPLRDLFTRLRRVVDGTSQ